MIESALLTVVAKAIVVSLGIVITSLAFRAYHRTGAESLKWMAVGFAIITSAMLFGGLVDPFVGLDLTIGIQIQNGLMAVGFVFLIYSIYARGPSIARG